MYYEGTADEWENISIGDGNYSLTNATCYYFSAEEPALNGDSTAYDGNYWHYDDDSITPVVW